LDVKTGHGPPSTSTTIGKSVVYSLGYGNPRQWETFPYPDEDRGTITLQAEDRPGGGTTLSAEGNKLFSFKDSATDFAIYFMLRRIEMADDLAELVCCENP
jgi:hypothetical protein